MICWKKKYNSLKYIREEGCMGEIKSKKRVYITVSLIIFLLIVGGFYFYHSISNQAFKPFNLKQSGSKQLNIKYGKSKNQALDLNTPKLQNGKKMPVIIYVHGGGWSGGTKSNVDDKPAFFVNKGYVFVSVEHRFSPHVKYQQMADDISSAVKWVYSHAADYQIDTNRINLMGHSSGGHLVMLIATNPKYLNSVGLSPSSISSVVSLEGPINLTDFLQRLGTYKKVFGNNKKVWEDASPETYAENKNLPPMLLVTRGKSSIAAFMEKAKKAGNKVSYFECGSLSHSDVTNLLGSNKGSAEAKNMTMAIEKFLTKYNF
jgi:acetyl esterase/lipase